MSANLSVSRSMASLSSQTIIDHWASSYEQELTSFDSVALFAETRLREIKQRESADHPSLLKSVVCADLIKKVTRVLGRYANILDPLVDELLNSIFRNYFRMLYKSEEPLKMQQLYAAGSYFDHADALADELIETQLELKMVNDGTSMREVVDKFKNVRAAFDNTAKLIQDACFFLWKDWSRHRAEDRRARTRRTLAKYWLAWQRYNVLQKGVLPDNAALIGINSEFFQEITGIVETQTLKAEQERVANLPKDKDDDFEKFLAIEEAKRLARERELEDRAYQERSIEKAFQLANPPKKELKDAETQTEPETVPEDSPEEEAEPEEEEVKEVKVRVPKEKQTSRMAVDGATALIAQIFEQKAMAIKQDPSQGNFADKTLEEFTKEVLIRQFGVKKLAISNLKSLEECCKADRTDNKRLQIFSDVCGVPSKSAPDRVFSSAKCKFFFRILLSLFPTPYKTISVAMGHKDSLPRETAMETMKAMFEKMAVHAANDYRLMEKAMQELPVVTTTVQHKIVTKVNIDDVLALFLSYADMELHFCGERPKRSLFQIFLAIYIIQRTICRFLARKGKREAPFVRDAEIYYATKVEAIGRQESNANRKSGVGPPLRWASGAVPTAVDV